MRLTIDEITEIKVVSTDVDKEFLYFDKLDDGSWRLVYTKSLEDRFVLHERTPEINVIDVSNMTSDEAWQVVQRHVKR